MEHVLTTTLAAVLRDTKAPHVTLLVSIHIAQDMIIHLHNVLYMFVVYSVCIQNPCQYLGKCRIHAGSYICTCMPGYIGYFCDEGQQ